MKKNTLLLILITCSSFLHAQELPAFFKVIAGEANNTIYSGSADTLPGGDFVHLVSRNTGPTNGYDLQVYRIDEFGQVVAVITLNRPGQQFGRDIKTTADGNIVLLGESELASGNSLSDLLIITLNQQLNLVSETSLNIDFIDRAEELLLLPDNQAGVVSNGRTVDGEEVTNVSLVNLTTESLVWSNQLPFSFPASTIDDGGTLVADENVQMLFLRAGFEAASLHSFDLQTGELRWEIDTLLADCESLDFLVIKEGMIYLSEASSFFIMSRCGNLLRIDQEGEVNIHPFEAGTVFIEDGKFYQSESGRLYRLSGTDLISYDPVPDSDDYVFVNYADFLTPLPFFSKMTTLSGDGKRLGFLPRQTDVNTPLDVLVQQIDLESSVSTDIQVTNLAPATDQTGKNGYSVREIDGRIATVSGRFVGTSSVTFFDEELNIEQLVEIDRPIVNFQASEAGTYAALGLSARGTDNLDSLFLIRFDESGMLNEQFIVNGSMAPAFFMKTLERPDGGFVYLNNEFDFNQPGGTFYQLRNIGADGVQLNSLILPDNFQNFQSIHLAWAGDDVLIVGAAVNENGYSILQLDENNNIVQQSVLGFPNDGIFRIGSIDVSPDGSTLLIAASFSISGTPPAIALIEVDLNTGLFIRRIDVEVDDALFVNQPVAKYDTTNLDAGRIFLSYSLEGKLPFTVADYNETTFIVFSENGEEALRQVYYQSAAERTSQSDAIIGPPGNTFFVTGTVFDQDTLYGITNYLAGLRLDEITSTDEITNRKEVLHLLLSPNPTTGSLTINWEQTRAADYQVELIDQQGRPLRSWSGNVNAGTHQFTTDLSTLAAGVYQIRLVTQGTSFTETLLLR